MSDRSKSEAPVFEPGAGVLWGNRARAYGFALFLPVLAAVLTAGTIPDYHHYFFELFQAAVVVAAWYGGFGPGVLSGAISFLIIDYFFIPPINQFVLGPTDFMRLVIFEVVSLITSFLSGRLKRANVELVAARDELNKHIDELKMAKSELERSQDQLEIRTEERTIELSQANKHLRDEIAKRIETEKAMLDITNREQRRLGQDLHDGLCQILTGVKFMSQGLRASLEEREIPESKRMAIIESQLGDALTYVDTVSRGLYPVELEVHGLMAALKELAEKTSQVYPIACRFKCWSYVSISDGAIANHLYRIAQEAVINAIKSGKAKRITIRLYHRGPSAILSVADDGVGFGNKPLRKGMGIKMMEYRARVINGSISFRSRPRGGTLMSCVFAGGGFR